MSDEDIKKALECCFEWQCHKCPMLGKRSCKKSLRKHALDFINRLQERIEELEILTGLANSRKYYRKFVDEVFCKQKGNELSEPDFDYIYQLYFEQQAEIERLQSLCTSKDVIIKGQEAEIERLVAECGNQSTLWRQHFESIFETAKETIKFEAIKEFAERLKKEAVTKCDWDNCVDVEDIDRLVAEMVGEQDV